MTAALRALTRWRPLSGSVVLRLFWLALAIGLLWLTLRAVNLGEVWDYLRRLQPGQLLLLLAANGVVLATFSARWWLLLYAQGYALPYHHLIAYRLATFAVSYFTPGPHFGGEPLQVYLATARHKVPVSVSIAAVVLDKVLEMLANFTFLTLGVLFILRWQVLPGVGDEPLLIASLLLLALPVLVLVALWLGWHPLSAGLNWLDQGWQRVVRQFGRRYGTLTEGTFYRTVRQSEGQSIVLCRRHPMILLLAFGASALSWAAIVAEFWFMTSVLGLGLTLPESVAALLAARVAILLPLPAALGALEASQMLAMRALGQNPAAGVSLSLLIRGRDMLLGAAGMLIAGIMVWGHKKQPMDAVQPIPTPSLVPPALERKE